MVAIALVEWIGESMRRHNRVNATLKVHNGYCDLPQANDKIVPPAAVCGKVYMGATSIRWDNTLPISLNTRVVYLHPKRPCNYSTY